MTKLGIKWVSTIGNSLKHHFFHMFPLFFKNFSHPFPSFFPYFSYTLRCGNDHQPFSSKLRGSVSDLGPGLPPGRWLWEQETEGAGERGALRRAAESGRS